MSPAAWLDALVARPPVTALLPVAVVAVLAPVIWWLFRDTWRVLDREAAQHRAAGVAADAPDYRPAVCLVMTALILTAQMYYGGRRGYEQMVRPWLGDLDRSGSAWVDVARYDELYGLAWWVAARVVGFVLVPLPLWKLFFPRESLLDMGFRLPGFRAHLGIYAACLAVVAPVVALVASQPDFASYYPFYRRSSRSWFDFLVWEALYWLQFLGLEAFFRGFMVGALRHSMGAGAIFVMAVPYCMIHYGKPYLEAQSAVVGGVVLGSLAMQTRSIYGGVLVHVTVAALMDVLALWRRGALPVTFWAPG
jgi:membrane protease YdiL (CAAX protease family)